MFKRVLLCSLLSLFSLNVLAEDEKAIHVSVAPLTELVVYPSISVPASALSVNDAKISAEVGAVISAISVKVGDVVQKGEILLQFGADDYRYALKQAEAAARAVEARIELAEYQLERTRILSQQAAASEENVKQREAELKNLHAEHEGLRAALGIAKENLKKCVVRAPFNAVVVERIAQVGELASKGSPLFQLVDISDIEISAKIQAQDVSTLRSAKEMFFEAQGQQFPVSLRVITPAFNPVERSREARFDFVNERALPGAAGTLKWRVRRPHVPADLMLYRGGQLGIFTMENGHAKFVPLDDAGEGRPAPVNLPSDSMLIVNGRYQLQQNDAVVIQ